LSLEAVAEESMIIIMVQAAEELEECVSHMAVDLFAK
jgi:hypothetical protein|tara:strand:+ start:15 stop:125 length:111 start_codon:yes stop_codon:yes gene_type:complete